MVLRALADEFGRDDRLDDFFHDTFAQIIHGDLGIVLRRNDDRIDRDGLVVLVDESYLALGVGPQVRQRAIFAHVRLAFDETM